MLKIITGLASCNYSWQMVGFYYLIIFLDAFKFLTFLGNKKIVEQLIKAGADVKYVDKQKWNTLHYAAFGGNFLWFFIYSLDFYKKVKKDETNLNDSLILRLCAYRRDIDSSWR